MKFELSENVVKNLVLFLDRVELKGINESVALHEIVVSLNNPIKEDEPKESK